VSDNAFGKVRTLVESGEGQGAPDPFALAARALEGLAGGHAIITDGPVLDFALDSCAHFSATDLRFLASPEFADVDGRMGGEGPMDGARTMLVAAGGRDVLVRYRFKNAEVFGGPLERIEVYRDEAGGRVARVKVQRNTGPAYVLKAQGRLDPAVAPGPDGWIVAPLGRAIDEAEQLGPGRGAPADRRIGPVRTLSALSLGGFTRRSDRPPYDFRVYTNPIWVVPVKTTAQVAVSSGGVAAPGALTITFKFPISMGAAPVECALVPLDANGASAGPPGSLAPAAGPERVLGWSANARESLADSIYTVANYASPVTLTGPGAPPAWGLYLKTPRDLHGNALNTVAWRLVVRGNELVDR
jgi:hypothetical protein